MKVCIAEKPSVAKEIAAILGAQTKWDGYFEGNGYQVTWTFGHLCTLKEPEDYHPDLKRWKLSDLPILPHKFGIKEIQNKGVGKQLKTITRLVASADEVINCGDAGQEGEVIQRWVLTLAKCKVPIRRLWISSLTTEAIQEGFKNLKESKDYDALYAAGSSRAIGDWLLGINATRLYTVKYGNGKQVLSIGRVQTPTLALIVNRFLFIQNFKPETYWELKTIYRAVLFSARSGKFLKKEEGEAVLKSITNHLFTITSFTKKKGKESAPRLFDLTSLQVECNKKYGFSADHTLKTIQTLYEKKLVTYPRVDTTYLSEDIYPKIKNILSSMTNYNNLISPLLNAPIRKTKSVFDDKKVTDHHAIIPTNVTASYLTGDEATVYDLIARRFIAVFYPDCIVSRTEVIGKVQDTEFKATGRQILEEGWRAVYIEEKKDDDNDQEEDQLLPDFVEGETGPHKPALAEKQTKPPKQHTEATLLRAMETAGKQVGDEELRELMKENGIGRPSTRANIIETLFKRNYIRKEKKNLIPTQTGIQLIQTISYELLKSAELTGNWEKKIRDIEKGIYDAKIFLEEMKTMVSEIVHEVKNSNAFQKFEIEVPSLAKPAMAKIAANVNDKITNAVTDLSTTSKNDKPLICPKCKLGRVIKGKSAHGCSEYKKGCTFLIPFIFHGKAFTFKQIEALVKSKKTAVIKGFVSNNLEVQGLVKFDNDFNLNLEVQGPDIITCPACKHGEIMEGKAAFGCSHWKNGCKLRIPFIYNGKNLTKSHVKALVTGKETPLIKGMEFPDGSKKNGKLKFGKNFILEFLETK